MPQGQTQVFVSVNGYAETSDFSLSITTGGAPPTTYHFNPKAVSFVFVKSEVDYISEASSSTDGNLADRIDQYTRTDRYEYVLEVDKDGKIIGGEWVGASKQAHPDFLWLPTGVSTTTVAGGAISYATVKELVMESVRDESQGGAVMPQTKTETGTLAKDAWAHFGPFQAAAGTKVEVAMTGTGDADLYVRRGLQPTVSAYDCRPYQSGSSESCSVDGGGPVFVSVRGYAATSNFSVTIKWASAGGTVTPPPTPAPFAHLDVSGTVALGEMKVFTLAVPAGKKLVVRTTAAADVDLYLQKGAAPTTEAFSQRAWTSSGNETLTFTATEAVTLHIGVHGYAASAFTLKTADE
ncbi:MAG: pre-peptidase C-terminal domain-containing protein [Myxococcota bacterium]